MTREVHKFGGSSLSSAARYKAVSQIIVGQCQLGDCVVVSAAGKTTNTLVTLWQSYEQQDQQSFNDILLQIENHQTELIESLFNGDERRELIDTLLTELQVITQSASTHSLNESQLLAHGELWSARILSNYLISSGLSSKALDARSLFTVHNGQLMHQRNKRACLSEIDDKHIFVVTGFIAEDQHGQTVTLGRNGSDYSATLLANYSDAKAVSIWTDTQGVFSTDPRKVNNAIKYTKVCREQANLLSRLGNPVLHAKTLSPLKNTSIKLQVRSSFDAEVAGTEIVKAGYSKAKRFITTFENRDLVRVEQLGANEIGEISQLIQHSIHHFVKNGEEFLLLPSAYTHQISQYFEGRLTLVESHLQGCALVAPKVDIMLLDGQAKQILAEQDVVLRFAHSDDDYALYLTDQAIDSDVLSILHDKLINKGRELAVIIAGLGNVGEVFIEQSQAQIARLQTQFDLKVVGLLRSQEMLFSASGINLKHWHSQWQNQAQDYEHEEVLKRIEELDYEHKVVIDITASESFSLLYPEFTKRECHIISANKYAGTAQQDWYAALRQLQEERNLLWRYNTSVGAGLPINFALADLQNSGDKVTQVEGVFSGTLSWLCSNYDGSKAFSDLVLDAKTLGYTEPDPREDLSGRDMQRKLLILARELGLQLDIDDIELEPLMPEHLAHGSWQDFLAQKDELDTFYEAKYTEAKAKNCELRYTGLLSILDDGRIKAKVGIAYAQQGSAISNLTPGDNIFVVKTHWYDSNPLVIQGPGAGKEVTAAGIHSDLFWLCQNLK